MTRQQVPQPRHLRLGYVEPRQRLVHDLQRRLPARPHWQEMREAAIDFLDRFGQDAIALGWAATALFGVHPAVGVGFAFR